MKPTLVCFDLGRVLVRIVDDWAQAHAAAGLSGAPPIVDDPAVRTTVGALVHRLETGTLPPADFVRACAELIARPAPEVQAMLDAWIRGPYPGAIALLDELLARGVRTACLSNTNERHWELMSGWQAEAELLWPRLQHRYASHELKLRKPDPSIYAHVESLVAVPSEILFFDDLADNIAAARARSWQAVQVLSREDPVREMRAELVRVGLLPH